MISLSAFCCTNLMCLFWFYVMISKQYYITIHLDDLFYINRYFLALQKELESYDCVLFEMVASRESLESRRNATATKRLKSSRAKGFNILGCIQRQMAQILTLDFQLDCLNYQSSNWYHADLDYETFKLLQVLTANCFCLIQHGALIMNTIRNTKVELLLSFQDNL